ncbi:T9SS type A sorting domain-containing protein [Fibrobacterota bacterium]
MVKPALGRFPSGILLLLFAVETGFCVPDPAFALTGTGGLPFAQKYSIPYYVLEGNYPTVGNIFHSVNSLLDPPDGHNVVREVAKLDVRNDGLGESYEQFRVKLEQYATDLTVWYLLPAFLRGPKPVFTWYQPNAAALTAAESLQIVETMRREKAASPPITGTVWTIGNEPNMFPSITPQEYAQIFTSYYNIIKNEDPAAQVALGELFLYELDPDLRAAMERILEQEFEAMGGLADAALSDVKTTLFGRFYQYTTGEYLATVLDALPASVTPDYITLHAYPFFETDAASMLAQLSSAAQTSLNAVLTVMAERNLTMPVWITEFGNIQPTLNAAQAAAQTDTMIQVFQGNASIEKWFYYKPTGMDDKLALFNDGQEVLTRLATSGDFAPVDGNFACTELNEIGLLYYLRAHGHVCRDLPANLLSSASLDTAVEEEPYSYRATKTDNSLPLVISFRNLPSWLTAEEDSVQGTPDDPVSDTSFMVTAAIDDRTDTLTVTLVVIPVNDTPSIVSPVSDTAWENTGYEYIAAAEDVDGTPDISFAYLPGWLSASGDTLRGIPLEGARDTSVLLIAGDGELADSAVLSLTVIPVNDTPVILSSAEDTATEDLAYLFVPEVQDPDNDPQVSFANLPSWLAASNDTVGGIPLEGTGDTSYTVIASDGEYADTLVVELTVMAVNDPPVITSLAADTVHAEEVFTYTAEAEDPDDSPTIGFANLPSWLSSPSAGVASGTVPAEAEDTTFQVTAFDGEHLDSLEVTITVIYDLVSPDNLNSRAVTFSAFPNPFHSATLISFPNPFRNAQVSIYTLTGTRVFRKQDYKEEYLLWNAEAFSSGLYLLRIKTGNDLYITTLVLTD